MKNNYQGALEAFPSLDQADEDGLLAMGGDLSPERLLYAYSAGIFPWFEQGQPILWWSPDPRCVLYPSQFKTSRSLKQSIKRAKLTVTFDQAFDQVITACAEPRGLEIGTWITSDMNKAYCALHALGCAHSVEVWRGDALVGGLYGVALGKIFYGESMFSKVADASKFGLKSLCELLITKQFHLIDCQVESAHLMSLGACLLPRSEFIEQMNAALNIDLEQAKSMGEHWSGLSVNGATT
ncbi:MAG: leucyl/phenylalanyl-tRNA--protein transferase [Arenicellales bacterium]